MREKLSDEMTYEDLSKMLEEQAHLLQGYEEGRGVRQAVQSYDSALPDRLLRAARVVREHGRTKKAFDDSKNWVKLWGAIMAAILALSTALVNQSASWATHNLDLGYAMLGIGCVFVVVAVAIAVRIGAIDPSQGQMAPKSG